MSQRPADQTLSDLIALRERMYQAARGHERLARVSMFGSESYHLARARNCDQAVVFINDEIERRERAGPRAAS